MVDALEVESDAADGIAARIREEVSLETTRLTVGLTRAALAFSGLRQIGSLTDARTADAFARERLLEAIGNSPGVVAVLAEIAAIAAQKGAKKNGTQRLRKA